MFGLLFILVCIAVYFHHRERGYHLPNSANPHQEALDILRVRYARGEIGSEEYNERKKILE